MEEKKTSKGIICLIVVLALIILGLICYIVYDKVIDKDDKKVNTKTDELNVITTNDDKKVSFNINSEEIKKLKNIVEEKKLVGHYIDNELGKILNRNIQTEMLTMQEKLRIVFHLYRDKFNYINMESVVATRQMVAVVGGYTYNQYVDEKEVENYFHDVFGPDERYDHVSEINFERTNYKYDENSKSYFYGTVNFGSAVSPKFESIRIENYKVESDHENIYLFSNFYTIIGYDEEANISECTVYNDYFKTETYYSATENCNNVLYEELKQQRKIKTYKSTYKKQSDGNYYFVEGEWQ